MAQDASTALIGTSDLSDFGVIEDFSGFLIDNGPIDAEHIEVPGRQGVIFAPGQYAAYTFPVPIMVADPNIGAKHEKVAALLALLDSRDAPLVVTRQVSEDNLGYPTVVSSHANFAVTATEVTNIAPGGTRVIITLMNLDGAWTAGAGS